MNARLLVNIIILAQGNASLTSLREQGYTYAQIADAISDAEDMGFLELVNNKIRVTNARTIFCKNIMNGESSFFEEPLFEPSGIQSKRRSFSFESLMLRKSLHSCSVGYHV